MTVCDKTLFERAGAFRAAMGALADALRGDQPVLAFRVEVLAARASPARLSSRTDDALRVADDAVVLVEPLVARQYSESARDPGPGKWEVLLDETLAAEHVTNASGARNRASREALRAAMAMARSALGVAAPQEGREGLPLQLLRDGGWQGRQFAAD